jgi:RNA polymerase sigma-70 factor, ECF subfamily
LNTPGLHRIAPPIGRSSDAELVARCCAGDRGAWRSLYERYATLVYRFLAALGVRDPDREDACQDVFMAVYRSLPSFRGESQLSTWIYRITARTTGKLIQKRRLRQTLASMMLSEPAPALPDPSEERTRGLMLDRMLDRLHPKKRLVLVLFELEGVPVEEIARVAGCPTNTVWSRLHHARLDLTKMAKKMADRSAKNSGNKRGADAGAKLAAEAAPSAEGDQGYGHGQDGQDGQGGDDDLETREETP